MFNYTTAKNWKFVYQGNMKRINCTYLFPPFRSGSVSAQDISLLHGSCTPRWNSEFSGWTEWRKPPQECRCQSPQIQWGGTDTGIWLKVAVRLAASHASYFWGPGFRFWQRLAVLKSLFWFSSVPPGQALGPCWKVGHDQFLQNPLQFITY
jgi:hypothetical protein